MDVKKAIEERRGYRSLEKVNIGDAMISDLAECASLAPSCYNNQPWRFVFISESSAIEQVKQTLSKGNEWAYDASMFIIVAARREDDCLIKEREYYLFDTGLATSLMMLRVTELGLVAHPIAGYNEEKVKEILQAPPDVRVIAILVIGKKARVINPNLSETQTLQEKERPPRNPIESFAFINKWNNNP